MKTYDDLFNKGFDGVDFYDYREAVKDDIVQYLEDNGLSDLETLDYECFISDSVTGNASGSYYCNAYKAERALCGNSDLLIEALEEFGDITEDYKKALQSPEFADCTIRCYMVSQVLEDAVNEYIDTHTPDYIKMQIEEMQLDELDEQIEYIKENA